MSVPEEGMNGSKVPPRVVQCNKFVAPHAFPSPSRTTTRTRPQSPCQLPSQWVSTSTTNFPLLQRVAVFVIDLSPPTDPVRDAHMGILDFFSCSQILGSWTILRRCSSSSKSQIKFTPSIQVEVVSATAMKSLS